MDHPFATDGRVVWGYGMPMHDDGLLELTAVIRRVLRARTSDADLIEDLTQDTLLRVAVVQPQLNPDVLRAYSIVTARNALINHHRRRMVAKRHAHRVVEFTSIAGPEHATLERGETDALAVALARLGPADRQLLLDHEVDNRSLDDLATAHDTSNSAIAMRLSRARALLRVEFVLAFRRLALPTDRCRPVLLALSAGDSRRQAALNAPGHLLDCSTCAELVEPVAHRRRGAAAWLLWPFAGIGGAVARFARQLRHNRWLQVATVTAVAAVVAGGVVIANGASHPERTRAAPAVTEPQRIGPIAPSEPTSEPTSTGPPITSVVSSPSATTLPATTLPATTLPATTLPATTLPAATTPTTVSANAPPPTAVDQCAPSPPPSPAPGDAGCIYAMSGLAVVDVAADEGFWVAYLDGQPIWVQLDGRGESPQQVAVGQRVAIRAAITPVDPGALAGMPDAEHARVVQRGVYLVVAYADLAIEPDAATQ